MAPMILPFVNIFFLWSFFLLKFRWPNYWQRFLIVFFFCTFIDRQLKIFEEKMLSSKSINLGLLKDVIKKDLE